MACRARKKDRVRVASASRSIEGCAPEGAAYYRLGIRRKEFGPMTFFGAFALDPFEPPRVPTIGVYEVHYFDAAGRRIDTPDSLSMGIFIRSPDPRLTEV
jgi:hypothetical protein